MGRGRHEMPIGRDIEGMLSELRLERRYADGIHVEWSPKTLHQLLDQELPGAQVIVVSNREPYIHNRVDGRIVVQTPASGLVSALEPIMRACGGVWVAHGSGSADRDTVDGKDRVAVPPDGPAYALRRVWISDEEQDGYYYGLANEGLWPLCHIAFVRPTFRERDWAHYVAVNRRFADVIVEEADRDDPIVLVQDYHFALLPRMLRQRLPRATIIAFWHIPWPNPETFGICPWREQIIDGLLGSSILGFHTQFHCNNFIEAVDRFMESRIDRERSSVTLGGHENSRSPLSNLDRVAAGGYGAAGAGGRMPPGRQEPFRAEPRYANRGWDRALRLHQRHCRPHAGGRHSAAIPCRVARQARVHPGGGADAQQAQHVQRPPRGSGSRGGGDQRPMGGWRLQTDRSVIRHHEPAEVFELFRAADLCIVSSLHDGMNLVAKEFVAARDDEQGVLVLSSFAGASRELSEALIVNPYDTHGMAETINLALRMDAGVQRERMREMRDLVRQRNVYRWAGQMLLDAARLRRRESISGAEAA